MTHLKIQPFLTEEEIQYFLQLSKEDEGYVTHKSTTSTRITNLNFKGVAFKGLRSALLMIKPNHIEDWHIDGPRESVIIHPLSEDYAPCSTLDGEVNGPIILDVKKKHAVFNNNNRRVSLQINCEMPFSTDIKDYQHILDVRLR